MTGPHLHDAPDPTELVLTVRDFLADEVLALVESRVRFHVRVSVNILDIVARQLASASSDEAAHRGRLAGLGFADDGELADAIRSGALDHRYSELAASVREDVWTKVGVVNPRYREPYESPGAAREVV
jgi:hypothetical protein